jgi:peptidoglycan/LPS O-acetylase OafA/YrhL
MKSNYTNLDLLRSLAVLSVVASHLWRTAVEFHLYAENQTLTRVLHNLSGSGVMFFFVHTCLVLMLSLRRAPAAHRTRSFLIRRAFRIYPLCWAAIGLVLATGWSDRPENNPHSLGWGGIAANFLLMQNMLKQHGECSVLGPLWSLPWEVQMYLLLPLFFTILHRSRRLATVFWIWLGATFLAVVATQPRFDHWHLHGAIFPPMFISGMAAYKLLERREEPALGGVPFPRWPAWLWPGAILALFAIPALQSTDHWSETPYGAVLGACVCMALGLAIPAFAELRAGWLAAACHQVARYSYGIYLLHVPAMVAVFRYAQPLPVALKAALALALTALASLVSFYLVEDPLIRLGKRLTQPGKTVATRQHRSTASPAAMLQAHAEAPELEAQAVAE